MEDTWVMKFSRLDGAGPVLLHVSAQGDDCLDLNLLATEGEAPYRGKIRHHKISGLRAKNWRGDDQEWQSILRHVFYTKSSPYHQALRSEGLEVNTTVAKGKITFAFRKRVDEITQRLGTVELQQDDDAEIQLFEWCCRAIDQKELSDVQNANIGEKYEATKATITSLDAKLEELVKSKAEHEEELMSKFVLLLNEKKLKIRNQQRLLSTVSVDKEKAKELERAEEGKGRQAQASRVSKRRRNPQPAEDSESSDAFETMDIDQGKKSAVMEKEDESSTRQTTPETESATQSEAEFSEPVPKPPAGTTKTRQRKGATVSPAPPVRKLPFDAKIGKQKQAAKAAPEPAPKPKQRPPEPQTRAQTADSGEETESGDDEL